jgi:epoxyqueuosine reductase
MERVERERGHGQGGNRPRDDAAVVVDRLDAHALAARIKSWGRELGFQAVGIAPVDLSGAEPGLLAWLDAGFHGEMAYMARHGTKRARPAELVPGTVSVVSARMDYWPAAHDAHDVLDAGDLAYVSRYALGRDYHKVLRARLQALADRVRAAIGPFGHRAFTDSAPVLEAELATRAGLGWRGKHTLVLDRSAGSTFFLGELFVDVALPTDAPVSDHCGTCERCITACPTGAIVAPYRLDARRCISYLTIELDGPIPTELRPAIGNRVYGCDDCQLACPWNKFAVRTAEPDFAVRNGLDAARLVDLFAWSEETFHARLAGSAIHRIGYARWLRNIAVGLGNAPRSAEVLAALSARADDPSPLVREHVTWALARQSGGGAAITSNPAGGA